MSPKLVCTRLSIVTLIALVHFLSLLYVFVFLNVISKHLDQNTHSHTGYVCLAFLHCAFSNVSSNGLQQKMHSHIGCICLTFLHCALSQVSSTCIITLVAFDFSPLCVFRCILKVKWPASEVTLVTFVWLFSTVRFQMCPQMV